MIYVLIVFPRKFQTNRSALELFVYVLIVTENLTEFFLLLVTMTFV